MKTIQKFIKQEDGVAAIEYGLLAGLIAVGIIAAVTLIGGDLNSIFTTIHTKLAAIPAA